MTTNLKKKYKQLNGKILLFEKQIKRKKHLILTIDTSLTNRTMF